MRADWYSRMLSFYDATRLLDHYSEHTHAVGGHRRLFWWPPKHSGGKAQSSGRPGLSFSSHFSRRRAGSCRVSSAGDPEASEQPEAMLRQKARAHRPPTSHNAALLSSLKVSVGWGGNQNPSWSGIDPAPLPPALDTEKGRSYRPSACLPGPRPALLGLDPASSALSPALRHSATPQALRFSPRPFAPPQILRPALRPSTPPSDPPGRPKIIRPAPRPSAPPLEPPPRPQSLRPALRPSAPSEPSPLPQTLRPALRPSTPPSDPPLRPQTLRPALRTFAPPPEHSPRPQTLRPAPRPSAGPPGPGAASPARARRPHPAPLRGSARLSGPALPSSSAPLCTALPARARPACPLSARLLRRLSPSRAALRPGLLSLGPAALSLSAAGSPRGRLSRRCSARAGTGLCRGPCTGTAGRAATRKGQAQGGSTLGVVGLACEAAAARRWAAETGSLAAWVLRCLCTAEPPGIARPLLSQHRMAS
ncbi:hypothetical protein LEMLEM_LOCUS13211 [Lemmus lemmus]